MIDFETDRANVLQKTDNIRSLADQVERLENLQTQIKKTRRWFKTKEKRF